jgi:hypothetical protein
MQDKRGILLLATGHPYYAHMAVNLLVSLRSFEPELPVAILHDGQGFKLLEGWQQDYFTTAIELPSKLVGGDPYRVKLHLDELTPFEQTMFMDVDMLWNNFHSPMDLFNDLDGIEFTMINRGRVSSADSTLSRWVNLSEVGDAYKLDEFYDISSEIIYFEGKPKVFAEARKVYNKPKVKVSAFGSGLPDEAFFMIAIEKLGIKLHESPWEPSYWEPRYFPKQHNRSHVTSFYALSVGGAFTSNHIKKIYDSLCSHYYSSLGIASKPYQLQNKSRIIKERRKI